MNKEQSLLKILYCSHQYQYYIVVIMEGKMTNESMTTEQNLSSWWTRKSLYDSFKKEKLLSKRLKLLENQKKKEMKHIENTLQNHKKQIKAKIDHYKHKNNITALLEDNNKNLEKSSSSNQALKRQNKLNLRTTRLNLISNNHKQCDHAKHNHQKGDHDFKQQKDKLVQQNIAKRNRVKLMELESKQKLTLFWDQRINMFEQSRAKQVVDHLTKQKIKLNQIEKMKKKEQSLLKQLEQAKGIREQLKNIMNKENRLPGNQLIDIYQ